MHAAPRPDPGASLSQTRNPAAPPKDFEGFWRRTLNELLAIDPQPRSINLDAPPAGESALAEMISLGGARVRVLFSGPRNHESSRATRPLLVTCHGYGGQSDAERVRRLAKFGLNVVALDARGFGLSRDAVPEVHPQGYLLTGCTSPEESILRGAVCDYIQAYRAAREWFGVPLRTTFQGFSFAGGLATMATSVLCMGASEQGAPPVPQILAAGAPTFGYLKKRLELCENGSGKELLNHLRAHPDQAERILEVFSYFDTCFFAPAISTLSKPGPERVILGVGTYDPIVPAETVYAIKNALSNQPELVIMPCSHTDRPEESQWVRWEGAWIRAAKLRPRS